MLDRFDERKFQVQQQLQNLPNEILPIAHNVSVLQCPPGQQQLQPHSQLHTLLQPVTQGQTVPEPHQEISQPQLHPLLQPIQQGIVAPQSNNPQIQADILSNLEQPPNVQTDGLT